MDNRILVKNGTIVTMASPLVIDPGYLVIKDTRIADIGTMSEMPEGLEQKVGKIVDAKGCLVLPGFTDAHYHAMQQFFRGTTHLVSLKGQVRQPHWKNYLVPFESLLSPEEARLSCLAAYVNMIRLGTTCVSEHGGRFPEVMAKAMEEVGIRGLLAVSTMDQDLTPPKLPANMCFSTQDAIYRNKEVITKWPFKSEGLVRGVCSLRQILVCSPRLIQDITTLAEMHNTMVQTHLDEGHYEVTFSVERYNARPAEFLNNLGALTPRLIAAHSVLLSEREVDLYAEHEVKVAHCPRGNFGMGKPKLSLMRRLGTCFGIGSDGAGGGSIDLFEAMRTSQTCQRSHEGAPSQDNQVVSPLQVLCMATIDGSRAVGLDREIGSLEAGKRADLIIVDVTDLNTQPMVDPIFTVVNCVSGQNVQTVIINGQIVMEDRKVLTVDEAKLRQEVSQRAPEIQRRFLETRV